MTLEQLNQKRDKMAKYRQLQTKFWQDPFIEGLSSEQKYFYIYMLTNPFTTQCGIYEITTNTMAFQSGLNINQVEEMLEFFEKNNKIKYSQHTLELCVLNFKKYNWTSSPKVIACINKELAEVKDKELVACLYGMDTVSQEKEKEKKEEKQKKMDDMFSHKNFNDCLFSDKVKDVFDFFELEIKLHADKYWLCCNFFEEMKKQEKLDYFSEMFTAYKKYKELSDEKVHSLATFIGSKSKAFSDGGWNSNNWVKKLDYISAKKRPIAPIIKDISTFKFK